MTLIELLLAIVIAVLVAGLVFSAYHMAAVTLQGQQARRAGTDAAAQALLQLARDLECAVSTTGDEADRFAVSAAGETPNPDSDLAFCAAVLPEGETDLRWYELQRLRYHVIADAARGPTLVRESQPLVGPGAFSPPATNKLAYGIERFRIAVYDGSEWKDEWPRENASGCPRAARIEIRSTYGSGAKTLQTEVFIPAGNTVTSSVVRAGTRGP